MPQSISPILSFPSPGRPYRGKPSDMWALGVVLFTMLYGQFPFYDSIPQELFRKIKAAEYSIPEWVLVLSMWHVLEIYSKQWNLIALTSNHSILKAHSLYCLFSIHSFIILQHRMKLTVVILTAISPYFPPQTKSIIVYMFWPNIFCILHAGLRFFYAEHLLWIEHICVLSLDLRGWQSNLSIVALWTVDL